MHAQIKQWSTESVAESQRLGFWMDSICDSFLEMKAEPDTHDGFFGDIRQAPLGMLGVYESRGSAQSVARDRHAIAKGSHNACYLITQLGSPWRLRHAGVDVIVQPGDSVLVDSREPYAFGFPGGLHQLSVQLPFDWLQRWLPEPELVLGCPVSASSPWGAALSAFKVALTPEFAADPGVPVALLQDHLGLLMNLAFAPLAERRSVAVTPKAQRDAYVRCVSLMRERLSVRDLVAQDVALAGAVSLRSLHRAFAAEGRTFAGVLREMRLSEAQRLLSDRQFHRLPVAEVAHRCGYADGSHFARQFRQSLGTSPGAFRALTER
jgi:AraC family transcriptional regulator, positive regulator of tynA and feaB